MTLCNNYQIIAELFQIIIIFFHYPLIIVLFGSLYFLFQTIQYRLHVVLKNILVYKTTKKQSWQKLLETFKGKGNLFFHLLFFIFYLCLVVLNENLSECFWVKTYPSHNTTKGILSENSLKYFQLQCFLLSNILTSINVERKQNCFTSDKNTHSWQSYNSIK